MFISGAHPNTQSVSGRTPLIQAIAAENLDIVKQLVKAGADLDLADTKGSTPLFSCFSDPRLREDIKSDAKSLIVRALIEGMYCDNYGEKIKPKVSTMTLLNIKI